MRPILNRIYFLPKYKSPRLKVKFGAYLRFVKPSVVVHRYTDTYSNRPGSKEKILTSLKFTEE